LRESTEDDAIFTFCAMYMAHTTINNLSKQLPNHDYHTQQHNP